MSRPARVAALALLAPWPALATTTFRVSNVQDEAVVWINGPEDEERVVAGFEGLEPDWIERPGPGDSGVVDLTERLHYGISNILHFILINDPETCCGASWDIVVEQDGEILLEEHFDDPLAEDGEVYDVVLFFDVGLPPLTEVGLTSPLDPGPPFPAPTAGDPPTFEWVADGGDLNAYKVDFSLDPSFRTAVSTRDLGEILYDRRWTMPRDVFDMLPVGRTIYWRVTAADLMDDPYTVVTSDDAWRLERR